MLKIFPGRAWTSIEEKARKTGLKRPPKVPISETLYRSGDVGFSAGMIIADGSVQETLISSGIRRGKLEGGGRRLLKWYSLPKVQVSMEDKESLSLLASMWGKRVSFCQKSSVDNDVWQVCVHGQKAYDLLRIVLPHLRGEKRRKALYLLRKYRNRKCLRVLGPKDFEAFSGMK